MIGEWLNDLVTWRNILRTTGLASMLFLIFTKDHPDPTALLACGAMMGLPSFIQFTPTNREK